MSEAHCNKLPQRKALGLVTHDNTGGPFVVECQGCGEVYPSFHCLGGEQIADTGDYEDARCPHCDQVDPQECDNAALAWNTQQLKINELQQRLNETDQRIDELGQSKELLREAYNEASPRLPYRIRQKIEQFFDGLVVSMSQDAEVAPIKGMIEARGGEYAIMIDENNGHYGWTFRKDSNGMWVSGRKATDAEMQAARQYARHTNQQ